MRCCRRAAIARAEAANKRRYGVMRAKKTYTNPYVEVDMWVDLESSSSPPEALERWRPGWRLTG
jgi:hypothetical protein